MAIKSAPAPTDANTMLDGMSVPDLTSLIKAAEDKRREKMDQAKRELIDEMRGRAEQLGLSLSDLMPRNEPQRHAPLEKEKRTVAPKYKFPSGTTWTGRGKRPREAEDMIASGRPLDEFLIDKAA